MPYRYRAACSVLRYKYFAELFECHIIEFKCSLDLLVLYPREVYEFGQSVNISELYIGVKI